MQTKNIMTILAMVSLSFTPTLIAQSDQGAPGGDQGAQMGGSSGQHHGGHLGKIEKADKIIGGTIKDNQGNNVGTIHDMAIDLESGRVLYTLVSSGGQQDSALPPRLLRPGNNENEFTLNIDKAKLDNAPKFGDQQRQNPGDMNWITQVYSYYGQPTWWTGGSNPTAPTGRTTQGFGNVQLASDLLKDTVKNTSNQDVGHVKNLAVNFPGGRLLYVIFQPSGDFGDNNAFYAIPPMAFTKGSDKTSLTTGIDKNTLASAPHFTGDNWQEIENPSYAGNIYRHYGKQAWWESNLQPTGRSDQNPGSSNPDQGTPKQGSGASDLNKSGNNPGYSNPNEGGAGDPAATMTGGTSSQPVRDLLRAQLKDQKGQNLGRITDVLVDLESGHVLYALVATPDNKQHALPPTLFAGNNVVKTDLQKLQGAPVPDQNNFFSVDFLRQDYNYFGLQPWWGSTPTSRSNQQFAGGKGTTHLFGMNVVDTANQPLGKIDNIFVNMPQGRVSFLTLDGASLGQNGQMYPIPPNALSLSKDMTYLFTGIDKNKLQSAPHVAVNNWQQLQDPSFAANVYQFYGKQPYWNNATSSQPGSRVYPQNP